MHYIELSVPCELPKPYKRYIIIDKKRQMRGIKRGFAVRFDSKARAEEYSLIFFP
jgi:hypothetical protein